MLYHYLLILLLYVDILTHHDIWTEPECQSDNEAYTDLTDYLIFPFQSLLVALENLDIVIKESEESEPESGDDHQNQVDVTDTSEEKHRDEDAHNDDDTTHRGHSFLLHTERVDLRVALRLEYLPALHPLDKLLAKPGRDEQRQDQCQQGAKRDIGPHV